MIKSNESFYDPHDAVVLRYADVFDNIIATPTVFLRINDDDGNIARQLDKKSFEKNIIAESRNPKNTLGVIAKYSPSDASLSEYLTRFQNSIVGSLNEIIGTKRDGVRMKIRLSNKDEDKLNTFSSYHSCQNPDGCSGQGRGFSDFFVNNDMFVMQAVNSAGNVESRAMCHRFYTEDGESIFVVANRWYHIGRTSGLSDRANLKLLLDLAEPILAEKLGGVSVKLSNIIRSDTSKMTRQSSVLDNLKSFRGTGVFFQRPRFTYRYWIYYNEFGGEGGHPSLTGSDSTSWWVGCVKLDNCDNIVQILNGNRKCAIMELNKEGKKYIGKFLSDDNAT